MLFHHSEMHGVASGQIAMAEDYLLRPLDSHPINTQHLINDPQ